MHSLTTPHPLSWKRKGPLLPVYQLPILEPGQSLCAECVPKTPLCPSGIHFFVFPSKPVQHALSTLILKLPREVRFMIYEHLSSMFKAYSGAFVTSNHQLTVGDTYMFDTGAWYATQRFRGEQVGENSILELEAAPWSHNNLSHFFNRTPARHLKCLHPQILRECIDDMCLQAGHVRLSMQYRNHQNPYRYDQFLFNTFAQRARHLTITVTYHSIYSTEFPAYRVSTLGYGHDLSADRLEVLDDLAQIFHEGGCRALVLNLRLNFDVPFTEECRLTVNEAWVQSLVHEKLTRYGCSINLCVYNRCDDRYQVSQNEYECPRWEHIFSHRSTFDATSDRWSPWAKQTMSVYEAAALECH